MALPSDTILGVLARNVAARGAHPFVIHEAERVTYAALDGQANRMAHALGGLGVRRGDRVTLALGNSVEYVAAAFGALKAGAVLNPVNPALGTRELSYILAHAEPRVIVTEPASVAAIAAARPAASTVASFGGAAGTTDLGPLLASSPAGPPATSPAAGDPSLLLYTSGTTGDPKGVLFTHGNSGHAGRHFVEAFGVTGEDVVLAVTPLFHGNAWGAVQTALHAGGSIAFPKAFSGSAFWSLAHESGATVLFTLGTILAMLLAREPSAAERTSRLRVILGLGSASIRDQVIRRFGVAHVVECFGSTDAGVVTITPLGAAPRPGSCGPAVPGVTIRILDDEGRSLAPGAVGEIAVSSPARMTAYFRDPDATARALRDGWFLTGDLGYLDADGWLFFVDRKRDVIRRGGENVSSVLVEKTLREHPAVLDAAVIGVPDPVLGQEIKAFVVPRTPVGEEELRAFAAERLARFQVPRLWEFRDALPKTPTQRVEKYKLRDEGGARKPLLG